LAGKDQPAPIHQHLAQNSGQARLAERPHRRGGSRGMNRAVRPDCGGSGVNQAPSHPGGHPAGVVGVGPAGFRGEDHLLEPAEQGEAIGADGVELRNVEVGVDEAGRNDGVVSAEIASSAGRLSRAEFRDPGLFEAHPAPLERDRTGSRREDQVSGDDHRAIVAALIEPGESEAARANPTI
jgi:hypothetical protein